MTTREIDTRKIESIKLPKSWKNGKAYIFEDKDTIIVKKVQTPDFSYVREKLRTIEGQITEEEIEQAVQAYRKEKYRG